MESLFEEFADVDKEAWLAKVAADAKGRSISDFEWFVNDGLIQSPFTHADDIVFSSSSFRTGRSNNFWSIAERIVVADIVDANKHIITALESGANALFVVLDRGLSRSDFEKLFQEVNFTYIETYFEIDNEILGKAVVENLIKFCEKNDQDLNDIRGGIVNKHQINMAFAKLNQDFSNVLPLFSFASVFTDRLFGYKETVIHEVSSLILALAKLLESGNHNARVFANINVGKSYLLNIAKIRAIHLLVNNLLKAYDSNVHMIFNASMAHQSISNNENKNLIQFTSQSMSAVIGGVDCLSLPASESKSINDSSPVRKRLSRNIQSIMQMESFMDKVSDPAAGSYYIEQLTDKIAMQSWSYIQNNS